MALYCLVAYIAQLYVALLPALHGTMLPFFLEMQLGKMRNACAPLVASPLSLIFCFSHVCHFCFSHVSHQFILSNKKTGWQLHEKKMQSDCWWHAADFAEQFVLNNFGAQDKVDLGEQCPEHF